MLRFLFDQYTSSVLKFITYIKLPQLVFSPYSAHNSTLQELSVRKRLVYLRKNILTFGDSEEFEITEVFKDDS